MKKIFSLLFLSVLCVGMYAQAVDFQKAVRKFKGMSSVVAVATRVDHKAAVANDEKFIGTMTIVAPDKMNISVADGKEQLDMTGDEFTMVMRGREHKTSSKKDNQFVAFQAVLKAIINADGGKLDEISGVTLTQEGDIITIKMDPSIGEEKKKRMLFSSFLITLDSKKGEFRTLRMNGRGKNYTEYSFSSFEFKQ